MLWFHYCYYQVMLKYGYVCFMLLPCYRDGCAVMFCYCGCAMLCFVIVVMLCYVLLLWLCYVIVVLIF